MTFSTSAAFAPAKRIRVPLAQIDVRGAEAARKLARVSSAPAVQGVRAATFNSSL